ncbi:MAG: oxygenase MpaB family protein [Polyangiales bacterium]
MTVSREDLDRLLDRLRRETRDPRAGIFGPESMLWRVNRESIAFLGGGRAALLQLAHPFVAHAVDQHSHTKTDLLGRFVRTFDNVFDMVFGDLETALHSAKRVHTYHGQITGQIGEAVGPFAHGASYAANTTSALLWVQATLLDTSIQCYELVFRTLSPWEKDAYYEESKKFGLLFGIREEDAPPDWRSFRTYVDGMSAHGSEIAVGRAAREMARFLMKSPVPGLGPVAKVYETMTAVLLPPRIREEFGFEVGAKERAIFRATIETLRRTFPRLPPAMRFLPAYNEALRRIGATRGGTFERVLSNAWDRLAKANRPHKPREAA